MFNTEALKYSIKRLNQLGYFKALEGRCDPGREDPGRRQQGRSLAQARRAEPQPADVRRRRVAVRRVLRAAVVPDLELPRTRRDVHDLGPAGQPRQELPAGVHRAVPVRPADDGRRRSLHPRDPLARPVHAGVDGRQPGLRVPDRRLLADVSELQPRAGEGEGPEPALPRPARDRPESVPAGLAADRPGRPAHHQQDLAELGVQHRRPADLPDQRHALHRSRSTTRASAATPTS